ncbi:MAG TPA: energy transducer TonB [Terriglobales bacterium]
MDRYSPALRRAVRVVERGTQAVKAVQTWKFDPAERQGEPVPVMINNVEVNFKLY